MACVLYSSSFIPPEWLAAHGFAPRRVVPAGVPETVPGLCPFAAAFLQAAGEAEDVAAVVVGSECDQMRRARELLGSRAERASFLFHVPATWQTPASHRLYAEELRRLGRFLVSLGGAPPDAARLADEMRARERVRRQYLEAVASLPARRRTAARVAFCERGELPTLLPTATGSGVPLALLGGPLLLDHLALLDLLEQAGGRVVLDGTDQGERGLPAPFDARGLAADPFAALAEAYFGAIPAAFRRPNSELYRWLERRLPESGARGLVFLHYLWCDTWQAEAARLAEWSRLPVLDLQLCDGALPAQSATRLAAFVEILS